MKLMIKALIVIGAMLFLSSCGTKSLDTRNKGKLISYTGAVDIDHIWYLSPNSNNKIADKERSKYFNIDYRQSSEYSKIFFEDHRNAFYMPANTSPEFWHRLMKKIQEQKKDSTSKVYIRVTGKLEFERIPTAFGTFVNYKIYTDENQVSFVDSVQ